MPFDFGTIVLVPFPFTDQSASKQRPAIVVSRLAYNLSKPDIVVMAITSQLRPVPTLGGVWVDQWREAGLLKPFSVKPVVATLEQRLVLRQLETMQPDDQALLRRAIIDIIG